jgi:MFS family permease
MLPLLILLRLHGTLLDVALAAVLYNISVILASVLWGYVTDRYPNRRALLVLNFGAYGAVFLLLGVLPSLPALFVLYTAIGFIAPAGSNASNLLILEQFSEAERPNAYASFLEVSILGGIVGVLVGYFWLLEGGALTTLLILFSALAFASVAAVVVGIKPSAQMLTTVHVTKSPESLLARLRHSVEFRGYIPFFPRVRLLPGLVARFRLWAVEEMRHELPLILAAGFLFNFASNLYNTSYTPYLESVGLATSAIFLVNFANNLTQGFAYPLSGALASREGSDALVRQATFMRSLGYLATAGFTFAAVPIALSFGMNALVFAVLGGAIALYSTASSLILFRGLARRDAGTILGVNSALGGVAAVLGSLASGLISFYGSFRLTFLVAAAALLISLPLWTAAEVAYSRRRGTPVVRIGSSKPGPPRRRTPPPEPSATG